MCLLLFCIANDEDDGGAAGEDIENVIDIVDAFKLKEINISKAEFTAYIKRKYTETLFSHKPFYIFNASGLNSYIEYLPKVKAHLTESGKADRVATF